MEQGQFLIEKKVVKYDIQENGCWNCTNYKVQKNGYCMFYVNGDNGSFNRTHHALHRVVYIYKVLKDDSLESDIVIRHKCDNRRCVNPDHLESGTYIDNNNDRVKRNRQAKGENNGNAKLSDADVETMRLCFRLGLKTRKQLAEMYDVSYALIKKIFQNKIRKI